MLERADGGWEAWAARKGTGRRVFNRENVAPAALNAGDDDEAIGVAMSTNSPTRVPILRLYLNTSSLWPRRERFFFLPVRSRLSEMALVQRLGVLRRSFSALSLTPLQTTRSSYVPCRLSPLASPLARVPSPSLYRAKSTQAFGNTRLKAPSKRKTKKYKLKTHQGAAARWMILANGLFKRGQAGRNHFNSKNRAWKRASKRDLIVSTSMQARRLKKLLPYFKRRYSK